MSSLVITDTVFALRIRGAKLIVNRYHTERHEVREYNQAISTSRML